MSFPEETKGSTFVVADWELYRIDGQHRQGGIQKAVKISEGIGE